MTKEEILTQLKEIALADYDTTINIEHWYQRIAASSGSPSELAKMYEIPTQLVIAIKHKK